VTEAPTRSEAKKKNLKKFLVFANKIREGLGKLQKEGLT